MKLRNRANSSLLIGRTAERVRAKHERLKQDIEAGTTKAKRPGSYFRKPKRMVSQFARAGTLRREARGD